MLFAWLAVAALAFGASAQETVTLSTTSPITISPAATRTSGSNVQTITGGSAQTTISAFVGTRAVASVVAADACQTVLALRCADPNYSGCVRAAMYGLDEVTITQRSTAQIFTYSGDIEGFTASLSASCDFLGTSPTFTAEACYYSIIGSRSGEGTRTSGSTTVSATITADPLPIVGGAERLPTGTATCSAASQGGAAPTAISEIYKVLVPVGAAVVAGAGALL